MMLRTITTSDPLGDAAVLAVRDKLRAGSSVAAATGQTDVPAVVRDIIAQVAVGGDAALLELTAKYDLSRRSDAEPDGVTLPPQALRVSPEEIQAAMDCADEEFLDLTDRAAENISRYQRHILVADPKELRTGKRHLGLRYLPLDRVGVYVPGGRAFYPSTVLMTVVPAQVAGVEEIAICTPPAPDGQVNPLVLALAGGLGINEVYRVGGAQAIAAMALGTESIARVDKIVGPGNAFVAEAKRQLFGRVGIDSVAGPSEVLIVADDSANPEYVAADMLAQAEHDPGSAILATPSPALAVAVSEAVERQLASLERREAIARSLAEYSAIIVTPDLESAAELADEFAPEHLQVITEDDELVLSVVQNAGAIFIGQETPVALGDYFAGPSHVLPTGGTARFFSPLSANDFRKASSMIRYERSALEDDAADVINFARREGLTAHARAVEIRLESEE